MHRLLQLKRKLDTAVFPDVFGDGDGDTVVPDKRSAPSPRAPPPADPVEGHPSICGASGIPVGGGRAACSPRASTRCAGRVIRETPAVDDMAVCPLCDRAFGEEEDRTPPLAYTSDLFGDDAYQAPGSDGSASSEHDGTTAWAAPTMLPDYAYLVL